MSSSARNLIYQFKITLCGIAPPVWRRIQVPEQYTFWDLHVAIQDAMGWLDYHLHAFVLPSSTEAQTVEIGIPDNESAHVKTIAGWSVAIGDQFIRPGMSLNYQYDFGDGWEHDVLLEGVLLSEPRRKYPVCLDGERACPPEDCGGVPGYVRLMKILRNPKHREYSEMADWLENRHAKNYWPYDARRFEVHTVRFTDPKKRWELAFSGAPNR
ncbi:Plasmid pRiA4b ORF-3-like protein [compost metagenome]